jgi:hypothetical protein
MPSTPMGLMKSGEGNFIPNSSIDKSRVEQSTIIRGVMPQCLKASALCRWVNSSPQPPWTYESTEGGIAAVARASSVAKSTGMAGSTPRRPAR